VKRAIIWYGSRNGVHFFPREKELMCHPNEEGDGKWLFRFKPIKGAMTKGNQWKNFQ